MRTIFYILIALLILMLMVTIHEFGHYIVGKILKFKINEFSIGFGPHIYKRNCKNGEIFSIRCIPLGGFCAFEGEEEQSDDENSFEKQAPWKRILVLIAGGMFNIISGIIFSILLLTFIGYDVMKVSSANTLIPTNTNNLVSSDLIYSIEYFDEINNINITLVCKDKMTEENKDYFLVKDSDAYVKEDYLATFIYENISVIESGNYTYKVQKISKVENKEESSGNYYIFKDGTNEVIYNQSLISDKFEAVRIVNQSLKKGDVIYKVNGERVRFLPEKQTPTLIKNSLEENSNTVTLTIKRNNVMQDITCSGFEYEVVSGEQTVKNSGIGIGLDYYRYGFFEAIIRSFGFTFEICVMVMQILWQLITGQIAFSSVGGPVTTIATIAGYSQKSILTIFILMPLIAANLGVFNLMPIPALDGSKVVFCLIEWVRGKPLNRDIENKIHTIGLLVLFGLVIVADIWQIISGDIIRLLFG